MASGNTTGTGTYTFSAIPESDRSLLDLLLLFALFLAVTAGGEGFAVAQSRDNMAQAPRARSGDIAIREELDAARRSGTRQAYDLFIARHPQHALVDIARCERARLGPAKE